MAQFNRTPANRAGFMKKDNRGRDYVEYKAADELRRLMTPNGKIYSRKRLGVSAREQRMIAQAIKRARYMALLPYTSATL
jgi:small subunit ribosomal protein S18